MEKKFESELGKRIVEGKKRQSPINMGIIAAAVVSCALLVGSAAFLLPAMAGAEVSNNVDFIPLIEYEDDYLVNVEGALVLSSTLPDDGDFDVKRSVSLKQATFSAPSGMSPVAYNKFVYSLNVNLRDLEPFVPEGSVVGDLFIPYPGPGTPDVVWSFAVNGVIVADSDIETVAGDTPNPVDVALVADAEEAILGIGCAITLPDMDYAESDIVAIQVMMKVKWYTDSPVDFTEIAFPAPPVADAGDDLEVYPGVAVTLDGSGSIGNIGIVSYTWTYVDVTEYTLDGPTVSITFSTAGEYVVTLTVEDADGLTDTVTITVLQASV